MSGEKPVLPRPAERRGVAVLASPPVVDAAPTDAQDRIGLACQECHVGARVTPTATDRSCPGCGRYLTFRECRWCRRAAETPACGPFEAWTCPWCDGRHHLDWRGLGPLADAGRYVAEARRRHPEGLVPAAAHGSEHLQSEDDQSVIGIAERPSMITPTFWDALRTCHVLARIGGVLMTVGWTALVLSWVSLGAEFPTAYGSNPTAFAAAAVTPPALLVLGLLVSLASLIAGERTGSDSIVRSVTRGFALFGLLASMTVPFVIMIYHMGNG